MSGKEFLIDAVAQFLQSSVWLDAVTEFLETHFRKFLVSESIGDGEKDCNDGADEKKGVTRGYSLEQYDTFLQFKDLVEWLLEQVIADLGCSGDDLVAVLEESARLGEHASGERRFFIKTLLSFEEYSAFCEKISQFAAGKQASGAVLEESASDTTPEYSEWILQLAIAKSILESKARGEMLDETEEGLVPWAEALVEMSQHADTTQAEEVSETLEEGEAKAEAETPSPADERMKELEKTLIREVMWLSCRLKVDLLVAQRIADANTHMKQQMLHLVASEIADQLNSELQQQQLPTGTDAENELAELFAQTETIQSRLKQVKTQCFELKSVAQPEMDKMYLFLKEKVHHQQDLVSQEKEVFEFIFSQIQESDAALVPLLLEWLLLESEGLRVQNQIQDQLNGVRDDGHWVQDWDEGSQAFFYLHSVTGESKWEAPQLCGYLDMNQQGAIAEPTGESKAAEAEFEEIKEGEQQGSALQTPLDEAASQMDATLKHSNGGDANQLLEMESVMERISKEHDEERRRLELLFQVKKEELRKRKERKRRERLAKKKLKEAEAGADAKEVSTAVEETKLLSPRLASPRLLSPRSASMKAETKDDSGLEQKDGFSIVVPGHGRIDLTHLLSDWHAKRFQERKGLPPLQQQQQQSLPPPQAFLNPSTLRYLTEKMIQRDPVSWGLSAPKQEIVLEESDPFAADEK